jgi:methylmalonyl-CoA mutase, N-terminal domain
VEALTDEVEKRAEEYIRRIDALGGAIAAIERGYIQAEIQEAAYRAQKAVESKEQVVVGVNEFAGDVRGAAAMDTLRVDPAVEQRQLDLLHALRARRDSTRTAELLGRIETAARGSENLMPLILTGVEENLTLGEICGALRNVWGEYHPEG